MRLNAPSMVSVDCGVAKPLLQDLAFHETQAYDRCAVGEILFATSDILRDKQVVRFEAPA
jgi:hypothetical protein